MIEPKNVENLCIIFDGLDEYPPAYSDPSNYIYKIVNCCIVFSPWTFFETSGIVAFTAILEFSLQEDRPDEHSETEWSGFQIWYSIWSWKLVRWTK